MKVFIQLFTLLYCSIWVSAADPLPQYIPSAPDANKNVSNYTVADVVGCVFTSKKELANGHPFAMGGLDKDALKTQWPGAQNANNIDLFLNYLVLVENRKDEKVIRGNIYWLIHEVMDVPNTSKVDAIMRVYNAQNNVTKKRTIAMFAAEVFPYLVDIQLLSLVKGLLSDDSVLRKVRLMIDQPNKKEAVFTVRRTVRPLCLRFIIDPNILNMKPDLQPSDYPQINRGEKTEQEYCDSMQNWMTNNWSAITAKANVAKANQNRAYSKPSLRIYSPRP